MSVNKILVNNSDSNYIHSIFDISEYTGNSYSTLSDALNAIPQAKHKGGMTIRYIDSNDKYVQYRLMSDTFNTTIANWERYNDVTTSNQPFSDLDISDEQGNVLTMFSNGHIKTKNFDSSEDATELKRGLMSANDKTKLNSIEVGAEVNDVNTDDLEGADLNISDEDGNILIHVKDGHIKTKNFDSSAIEEENLSEELLGTLPQERDSENNADLEFSDEQGNVLMQLENGHIKTKNFDSANISFDEIENQIEGLEDIDNGLSQRISYLESLPSTDIENLSQYILTQCRDEFAPIGHADISFTPKKEFKILFIGNSVTQDHTGYLPWLFTQLYANEVDFTIGNFYYGGRTIKEYVQDFIKPDDPWKAQLYAVAHNTSVWTGYANTKTLADVVTSENWDFISIQAYVQRGDAEDISMTPQLVQWLRSNCPSPFELCYLTPQCFNSAKVATRNAAITIIKENPVSLLFAPYFCIEEAQKYWSVSGVLSPEGDGTHLREGFPVMITGMHLMDVLCRRLGLSSRIIKNHLVMTTAINNTLGNHGGNGTVDDTMATDAVYEKVQYCSIQGTKQAEAWYNKAINELITNYN